MKRPPAVAVKPASAVAPVAAGAGVALTVEECAALWPMLSGAWLPSKGYALARLALAKVREGAGRG